MKLSPGVIKWKTTFEVNENINFFPFYIRLFLLLISLHLSVQLLVFYGHKTESYRVSYGYHRPLYFSRFQLPSY